MRVSLWESMMRAAGSRFSPSSWRPLFLPSLSSLHRSALSHHSAAAVKDYPLLCTDCSDFLPWLQQKTDQEISSKLSIGHSIYGRSLFASKFIEAGECILKVPYSAHLTPEKILPEVESFISADISNIGRLAVVLLAEKKLGQDSAWAPYINNLPRLEEMHNTIFWDKDELEMVQLSSIYQETLSQKICLEQDFSMALRYFPQTFGDCTFHDFMHAYAIVGSRAWGTTKGLSLIPFADFLNHDGNSESVLLSDEDKETSEVFADRDYHVGEQVMIRYGKFPNVTLLLDFGFTLTNNMHDQVQIWMDVPQHDPLCTEKLEVLLKHRMSRVTKNSDFHASGFSFTIKEVRSAQGKGKGIPQSLRAFVRVLSAKSTEELKAMESEAAEGDGRLARCPLNNKNREIGAHQFLISHIIHLIRDYDSSIELLGPSIPVDNSIHSVRRKMARDLLISELRVLNSACLWLTNYCKRSSASGG